jgi:hypothetical protein
MRAGLMPVLPMQRSKARLIDLGGTAFPSAPSEFGAFIAAEAAKWGKVVKFANLKPK